MNLHAQGKPFTLIKGVPFKYGNGFAISLNGIMAPFT